MIFKKQQLNKYIRKIRESHTKVTPQRIKILNIFLDNKGEHFKAEDIINQIDKKIGQATVYRTLERFCQIGILKKVNFKNDEFSRYDLINLEQKHFHHHLICDHCGDVIEMNDDLLEHIENRVQNEYHFKILNHELVLHGICATCQRRIPHETSEL